jgi:hypothetical protein
MNTFPVLDYISVTGGDGAMASTWKPLRKMTSKVRRMYTQTLLNYILFSGRVLNMTLGNASGPARYPRRLSRRHECRLYENNTGVKGMQ